MPAPLSHTGSKLLVIGFILSLGLFILVATILITRGMNDKELQARIEASRQAREAGIEAEAAGLDDPGEGGKAVRLPGAE